jgi:hypothetical protein
MKKIATLFMLTISIVALSQKLKTYNGAFTDGKSQNGNAVYTYYEDPETHEYLKQGIFKYSFAGKGDYKGYNQTISGSFDKGLKNGLWSYTISMVDFGNRGDYSTGTVTLVANYKNGYANGNWKEVRSIKTRRWNYYNWTPFGPLKTMNISMNFKDGSIVGNVNINDGFAKFKVTGNYDNNSLCTGTWMIDDLGWGKHRELIYKDNFLYEFIARDNNGKVLDGTTKYQTDYDNLFKAKALSPKEREEAGISLDTACGSELCAATNNIKEYFNQLLLNEVFLYDYIGGDLIYKEGFKGGCEIKISTQDYISLTSIAFYNQAEENFIKNQYVQAYDNYSKINLGKIKPTDNSYVTEKINFLKPKIEQLLDTYHSNNLFFNKYIEGQYDSIRNDYDKQIKDYKIVEIKDPTGNQNSQSYNNKLKPCWNIIPTANLPLEYFIHKVEECFSENREFYEVYQIAYVKSSLNYIEALEKEGKNIEQAVSNVYYENNNYKFSTYEKATFLNNLIEPKKNYELSKSIKGDFLKAEENKTQIIKLNEENKKKIVLQKYLMVYEDLIAKINAYSNLTETASLIKTLNTISDKVITLYSQDTKELEKQLKDVETMDQIKSILLKEER